MEMAYIFARYMHGDPVMRRLAYEQLWAYVLAWVAITGIVAIYEDRHAITSAILTAFGLPQPKSVSVSYIDWLMEQELGAWAGYWILYIILKTIGGADLPVASGLASGVADFLSKWVGMQVMAFQWFVADLAILTVLTMFYEYSTKYGLFAVYASLIVPRSTRPIGASLTAYYVVLSIMLPVFFGMVLYEMPFTEPIPIYIPCNPFTAGWSNIGICLLEDAYALATTSLISNYNLAPYDAYVAYVWDALLDLAYILSWLVAYWIASLMDTGASHLLERITRV
mgnify:CR=1 FL=1